MPDFSQNLNRYSYCLNNPLVYVDETGEFFVIDSWIAGLFSGGLKEANKRAKNDLKIWGGLFTTDKNKSFFGQVWEIVSRFTYQLPQTIGGWGTAHAHNTFGLRGGVDRVDYKFGATVVKTNSGDWGAITQGNYIVGDNTIKPEVNNSLFQHEYGHYIQSQQYGWFYYPKYGIPSALSKDPHKQNPVEQDANARAFKYFSDNVINFNWTDAYGNQFTNWKYRNNPINGYNWNLPYSDITNQNALNNNLLDLSSYDLFLAPLNYTIIGMAIPGVVNTLILNHKY
jgi:hypothetical protein